MATRTARARRLLRWAAALLGLLVLAPLTQSAAQTAAPAATFDVYLPVIVRSADAPPPPPSPIEGGVFPLGDPRTTSAAIALDAAGGTHVAFVSYEPDGAPPAYYGYCAPGKDCVNPASWQLAIVGRDAEQVQIQVTPAGKPRMIYRTWLNDAGLLHDYYYAECDSGCADAAGWRSVRIGGTSKVDALDWDLPQRSFALDRLGRPRLVYYTGTPGEANKGAFYLSCDTGCTDAAQWSGGPISLSSTIGEEIFNEMALTFTSASQPRIVANIVAERPGIYYLACDQDCTDSASWSRAFLVERGYGPLAAWDVELDAQDRPRVAIYVEGYDDGTGDALIYAWCDGGCADGDSWYGGPVGLPQDDGHTPDLELDSQGRPRIAYRATAESSVGYLWCDVGCEADGAQWKQTILEQRADLDARYPIALPPTCEQGFWSSGYQPMLALDAQGNPRVASESKRLLRCLVSDPQDPGRPPQSRVVEYRHARFLFAIAP